MTLSHYDASVATFRHCLKNLDAILDKASDERGDALEGLLHARLAPDMHDLTRQIQICSDIAKSAAARLAGIDPPVFADEEATLPELKQRIAKTLAFLDGLASEKFENAGAREIQAPIGSGKTIPMRGNDFLLLLGLPNFYFHYVTTYAILRHHGVTLGKHDFLNWE